MFMCTARVTGLLNTYPSALGHPVGDSQPPRCLENPVQTDPIVTRCPDVQLPSSKAVFTKCTEAKGSTPSPRGLS